MTRRMSRMRWWWVSSETRTTFPLTFSTLLKREEKEQGMLPLANTSALEREVKAVTFLSSSETPSAARSSLIISFTGHSPGKEEAKPENSSTDLIHLIYLINKRR